jgi:putative zinc finger/helix-turn-helix YgiT family protein
MKSPYTGKEMILCKEERHFSFRKEEFTVVYHFLKCPDSDESFTTTELDDLNLNQLYNQYRLKYKLPFPDEIKQLREMYEVSASKMSEVLGFGPNSYRNYENGEVPNLSNSRLIQLVKDAREFKKLLLLSNAFEGRSFEKFLNRLELIIKRQKELRFDTLLKEYLIGSPVANNFTGFRLPDLSRFTEMIIFFAEKLKPYKTKLNKLLFYADFIMYEKSGFSMSGMKYRAIIMGPVPENYDSIYDHLARNDEFDIIPTLFQDGGVGDKFKPNAKHKFNPDLFSAVELSVLEDVAKKFRNTSTNEIIDISHKEKGWIENKHSRGIIDYKYGFDIDF